MIVFDIIMVVIFILAVYYGFKDGILVQAGGLVGLLIGVYLAFRFGARVGQWFGLDEGIATVVGFVVVLLAVILLIGLVGHILRGAFRFAGLGILDRLGGAVLSFLKVGLIMCLLIYGFDSLNKTQRWIPENRLGGSLFYDPMLNVNGYVFPYLDLVKDVLIPDENSDRNEEPAQKAV